jgi:hypothetical protein
MARVAPIFESMNGGEYSPLLEARVDYAKYKKGLKLCVRFIPLVQGPLTKCPGTYFVGETRDSSKLSRLVPFEFSVVQAYQIEVGDQYCRFFRNHAPVTLTAQNITAITQANPAVVTYAGADYSNGDRVILTGIVGMTQLNNREFIVANVNAGANTFELSGINSAGYSAYASGGSVAKIYEIATPYLEADLAGLYFAQSADILYIAASGYAPRKLSRTGHTSWTLSAIDFLDGPYLPTNSVTANTLTPSATSGSVTLTAVNDTFASTDVGRLVRFKDSGNKWSWLKITAYTNAKVVTATVMGPTLTSTTASATWRLGVWSATTGYPVAVTFFGDRLFWGGPSSYPQRLDGSVVGDYENYAPSDASGTVADDNAVAYTLNANNVNAIIALADDEKGLVVLTTKGEWIVRPSSLGEALTPTNIDAKRSTSYGSRNVAPARVGKATVFVQRAGRKLREMAYVYEDDGFRAPDMTVQAEHITKGGVAELAYQSEPQSIIWARRADGVLLGFTYEREQEVLAWHRHPMASSVAAAAVVESISVIPTPDGNGEELWLMVRRTINGNTKRHVEYMGNIIWDEDADQADAHYVDCGLVYDGAATQTISGLNHLEGETVTIWADGATHPTRVVTGGVITLNREVTKAHIGLGYIADAWTERVEAGSQNGTAQGKIKRIHEIILRVWQTLGLKVGPNADNLVPIVFRKTNDSMSQGVPLFSGDKDVTNPGSYEKEGRIYVRSDQPSPATISGIIVGMETNDS